MTYELHSNAQKTVLILRQGSKAVLNIMFHMLKRSRGKHHIPLILTYIYVNPSNRNIEIVKT